MGGGPSSDGDAPAVLLEGVTVRYGASVAVDGLSLAMPRGEVLGFVGPNGAGKTTTIRALLDLLRPHAGRVELFGTGVRAGGGALRARVGYLPADLALFGFLSGAATLALFSRLQSRPPVQRDFVLERLGFRREALARPVRTYSTGMRQQLGIACALQHDPELAILDEPTSGLDPLVRAAFLDLVRGLAARGRTVFLSSHVLGEIEDCANRIALIHRGRLRLLDDVNDLRARLPRSVVVRFGDGRREAFAHAGTPAELVSRLAELSDIADLEVRPPDLGEIFRTLVAEESAS